MKPVLFLSNRPARRLPGAGSAFGLTLAVMAAIAVGTCAPGARAQSTEKSNAKDYALAHKSVYTPSNAPRNPFWPIGWVPSAPVAAAEVAAPTIGPESFVVSSISLDFPPLAVINKRTYGVGDRIPVPVGAVGTTTATGAPAAAAAGEFVTVSKIADGTVTLDHRGKPIRVTTTVQATGPKK